MDTAGFMKTVPSAYTLLMNTIYLYPSTQEAEVTVFRKHTIYVILMYVYIFVCQYVCLSLGLCIRPSVLPSQLKHEIRELYELFRNNK